MDGSVADTRGHQPWHNPWRGPVPPREDDMNIPTLEGRLSVSIPEAALLLGLSRNSVYAAAGRGELPTIRVGRRILVPVGPLQELVAAGSMATSLNNDADAGTGTATGTGTDTTEGAGSGREGAA